MLENLKYSINSILDLYKQKTKAYYGFSLGFLILASIFTYLFSASVICTADWVFKVDLVGKESGAGDNYLGNVFLCKYTLSLSYYLLILAVGLYAVYIRKIIIDPDPKPSIGDFFRKTGIDTWLVFIILAFIIGFIYAFTIKGVFIFDPYTQDGPQGILNNLNEETRIYKLYKLLNSMINLIVEYLPYIGGLYILLSDIYEKPGRLMLARAKSVLLPVLILCFCANAIGSLVQTYMYGYISNLFSIPFMDAIAPAIFEACVYIIISAYFYIAFAGAFVFPVMYDDQKREIEMTEQQSIGDDQLSEDDLQIGGDLHTSEKEPEDDQQEEPGINPGHDE